MKLLEIYPEYQIANSIINWSQFIYPDNLTILGLLVEEAPTDFKLPIYVADKIPGIPINYEATFLESAAKGYAKQVFIIVAIYSQPVILNEVSPRPILVFNQLSFSH